jgi:hypothetical protein
MHFLKLIKCQNKSSLKTEKPVTFLNVINHFLINAKLRILPNDLNA